MIYIIKSDSYRLLKAKINELTSDIDKEGVSYYDLTYDNLKDILEESSYSSLFETKKASVIYNAGLFGSKHEYKEDLELLGNYLNNDNILIFVVDNISLKKSIVKKIKEMGNLYELSIPEKEDLNKSIKEYLKKYNYKIENNAIIELINRCNGNYDYILNELDKVLIVKKDYVINKEDIEKYTINIKEENIFDFVDKIVKKDVQGSLMNLNNILETYEVAVIFSNLASQYRLILSTKNLISEGLSEKDIATKLKVHPYRIKLAHEKSFNYSNQELIDKLLYIGELDQRIKLGEIDKNNALKIFIINM